MRYAGGLNRAAFGLIVAAVAWDLAASIAPLPLWWPTVSYVSLAVSVAVGCAALLIQLFGRGRGEPRSRGSVTRLVAIGLVLGVWLLRAHPEIPPDPPLVAGALAAGLLFASPRVRLRWPARNRRPPGGHSVPPPPV